jgi:hypothetical protein
LALSYLVLGLSKSSELLILFDGRQVSLGNAGRDRAMLPQFFDRIDAFRRGFTNRAGLNVRSNDLKAISRLFLSGRFLMDLTKNHRLYSH